MKSNSIEQILEDLGFSKQERRVFIDCLYVTKEEQENKIIKAEDEIFSKIKELIDNEIS